MLLYLYENVLLNFYLCNLFWEGSKIRSVEQETSTPIFATGSNRANLTSFIVGSRTPILCWFLLHNSRIIAISLINLMTASFSLVLLWFWQFYMIVSPIIKFYEEQLENYWKCVNFFVKHSCYLIRLKFFEFVKFRFICHIS